MAPKAHRNQGQLKEDGQGPQHCSGGWRKGQEYRAASGLEQSSSHRCKVQPSQALASSKQHPPATGHRPVGLGGLGPWQLATGESCRVAASPNSREAPGSWDPKHCRKTHQHMGLPLLSPLAVMCGDTTHTRLERPRHEDIAASPAPNTEGLLFKQQRLLATAKAVGTAKGSLSLLHGPQARGIPLLYKSRFSGNC